MQLFVLTFFLSLALGLELRRDANDAAANSEAAFEAAWRDDQAFIKRSWHLLVGEMQQLEAAIPKPAAGLLQVGKHPFNHTADKLRAEEMHKVMAATKLMDGKAMLMPALGMLTGLYEEQKGRITELNKRESKGKGQFVEQTKRHDERMAHYKDILDHHKISQAFYENCTKGENHQFTYWQHVRERAHRQFHTQLKLMHGLMSKEKGMITAYNKALADKVPTKEGAQQIAKATGQVAPEIALIQSDELLKYCHGALATATHEAAAFDAEQ